MKAVAALGFLPADSFNVIVLMAVFTLISLGLHFTFGLLNLVNLAHGEFLLIGAYTAFQVQDTTGSVVLGILAAPVAAAVVAIVVERGIIRFFYERTLDSLLATFGISVIVRQLVQLIYSANPRTVRNPIGGAVTVAGFVLPRWRLALVIITVALVTLVWVMLERTAFGLRARASVRNPALAETMGVNVGFVRAGLFTLGCALAGLAGGLLAPINTLNPQFGLLLLVNSFLVVILGRQGSLRGLILAAVVLGGSLSILQFVMRTVYAQVIVLLIAIVGVRLRRALAERIVAYRERGSDDRPRQGAQNAQVDAG